MYRKAEGGEVVGILTDFDLAISLEGETVGPSSNHFSGTAPFMARDRLLNRPPHALHHDFESALYILVWVAVGYKGWMPPEQGDLLSEWRGFDWEKIAVEKIFFLLGEGKYEDIDKIILPEYKQLETPILELQYAVASRLRRPKSQSRSAFSSTTVPPLTSAEFFDCIGPPPTGCSYYIPNLL